MNDQTWRPVNDPADPCQIEPRRLTTGPMHAMVYVREDVVAELVRNARSAPGVYPRDLRDKEVAALRAEVEAWRAWEIADSKVGTEDEEDVNANNAWAFVEQARSAVDALKEPRA